jgi:hypothetical protein
VAGQRRGFSPRAWDLADRECLGDTGLDGRSAHTLAATLSPTSSRLHFQQTDGSIQNAPIKCANDSLITTGTTGYLPNQSEVAVAEADYGPWKVRRSALDDPNH